MPPSAELAAVVRARARHASRLRAHPNVIGTAAGPRFTGGRATGDLAVKVYVERKLPGLPEPDAVPRFVDGVRTDVIATGPARALSSATLSGRGVTTGNTASGTAGRAADDAAGRAAGSAAGRVRPVRGGGSVGFPGSAGGTIATVCFDLRTGRPHLLSNHHVLVMAPGTRLRNRVLQPGGGDPDLDVVGRLARAAPLRPDRPNRVDAAIARLDGEIAEAGQVADVARVDEIARVDEVDVATPVTASTRPAELGQPVRKTGVTTGTTSGHVVDLDADIVVEVRGRPVRFTGQLVLDLAAAPGDSGSLVVTAEGGPIGLLFAGTDAFVLANPLPAVLSALRIKLPGA